ncbi:hypothetical protein M4951_12900 [Blastopirellula sp. J2-11]|uniref:hypothetical protein n=1 Tax=Blastopirellula sp. J2-11 TaxID=2943192 RepID=UPI0021C7730C|nr:hypothetical protein [Blastopirellula sp. J2-11]UUO09183.1 hypothetical protein M4951_12900 [Blastopirellula sp. J2-11]
MSSKRSCVTAVLLFFMAGCSASVDGRYAVNGHVSYKGKPVPSGEVSFEPDTAKGEHGQASLGRITNGKYEIPAEYGVRPAAYIARVTGYTSLSQDETAEPTGGPVRELFPVYITETVFPEKNSTFDIAVPPQK